MRIPCQKVPKWVSLEDQSFATLDLLLSYQFPGVMTWQTALSWTEVNILSKGASTWREDHCYLTTHWCHLGSPSFETAAWKIFQKKAVKKMTERDPSQIQNTFYSLNIETHGALPASNRNKEFCIDRFTVSYHVWIQKLNSTSWSYECEGHSSEKFWHGLILNLIEHCLI